MNQKFIYCQYSAVCCNQMNVVLAQKLKFKAVFCCVFNIFYDKPYLKTFKL